MAIKKEVVKKVAEKTVKKTGDAVNTTTQTAMGDSGKSLFFLIVSMVCFWLILDLFYGKKLLNRLVDIIFGDDTGTVTETTGTTQEKTETKQSDNDKGHGRGTTSIDAGTRAEGTGHGRGLS